MAAAKAAAEKKQAQADAKAAEDVEAAVKAWAAAWSGQDLPGYLATYSETFTPADGSSLAQWQQVRGQRMAGKGQVEVDSLAVSVDGGEATAKFRQHSSAGGLVVSGRKTLMLRQENGQWRIVQEVDGR